MEIIGVPSKKAVRRAGIALRCGTDDAEMLEIVSKWRSAHAYPLKLVQGVLRKAIASQKVEGSMIAQRIKRLSSITGKLKRFDDMCLDRMQDIGGIRAVVKSIDEVYKIENALQHGRSHHELQLPPHDYIQSPKSDGYRSLHQVFRIKSSKHHEIDGLSVELQIRTQLQHSWATAVETIGMVEKASFKTGEGDERIRQFFRLASALFAIEEKTPLPSYAAGKTREELTLEIRNLEQTTKVLPKLEGLAIGARRIETTDPAFEGFNVLLLDLLRRKVSLTSFKSSQLGVAEELYMALEHRFKDDPLKQAVLISAGTVKDIKKAYPNYFLDTASFTRHLNRLMGKAGGTA